MDIFSEYTDEELADQINEAMEYRDWYSIDLIWDELERRKAARDASTDKDED